MAGKAKEQEKVLFSDLLTRKSGDLEQETADIVVRKSRSAYQDIMRDQVSKIDEMKLELKSMTNLNISNNLNDASRMDDKSFDAKEWVSKYDRLTQTIELSIAKVKISDANYEGLFGESYLAKEGLAV